MTFVTQVLAAARVLTSGYLVGRKLASENARIASDRFLPKKKQLHECVIRHSSPPGVWQVPSKYLGTSGISGQ